MRKIDAFFWFCIICVLIISCTNADDVKFESPQPAFENEISGFGKKIIGLYENADRPGELLQISEKSIVLDAFLADSCLRSEIEPDSGSVVDLSNNDSLINYLSSDGAEVKIVNDSIFFRKAYTDTIFSIGNEQVLKKFRNDYFLNYKLSNGLWNLKVVYFKHDTLFIDHIEPNSSLDDYNYVSKNELDTGDSIKQIEYILNPDKKEFKKLMESGMLKHEEKYIRRLKK